MDIAETFEKFYEQLYTHKDNIESMSFEFTINKADAKITELKKKIEELNQENEDLKKDIKWLQERLEDQYVEIKRSCNEESSING